MIFERFDVYEYSTIAGSWRDKTEALVIIPRGDFAFFDHNFSFWLTVRDKRRRCDLREPPSLSSKIYVYSVRLIDLLAYFSYLQSI